MEVAVLAMLVGIVIGLALAIVRMSGNRFITWFATGWIELARNTPALLQLFFFGFGLGAFGIHLSPFMIVLYGLSFNNAGYLAEIFRGGFQRGAADPDQGGAFARHDANTDLYADRNSTGYEGGLPSLDQSDSVVGFDEFTGYAGGLPGTGRGKPSSWLRRPTGIFEFFLVTAGIYYVIVKLILGGSRLLSWRLFRY